MQTPDISIPGLFFAFLLLVVPAIVIWRIRLPMLRESMVAMGRMVIQLSLAGVYLTVLFEIDNAVLNVLWLLLMIGVAAFEAVRKERLSLRLMYAPTMIAFAAGTMSILLYFQVLVLENETILAAQLLIPIAGMLLGNSLGNTIVAINNFSRNLHRNQNRYLSSLGFGATKMEGLMPYFREALASALKPSLGNIAVMGIVFLPGLMTGQLIAGLSPVIAIKYQISILIAIYSSTVICVTLAIYATTIIGFDEFGLIKEDMFSGPVKRERI
ncbi:hypothetical protein AZH53_02340 [Methanomicrobiaceae archaeon CYW5]|uniref:ABC transporter permease n=1 Tax=Methanovulcanius yangii TaxID=1789227 RepID=UPI0029CA43A8|nr:ABC transporter permease [Methanovulcanius yangii]MBT8507269.1 hypothetical protein [Methanovulcanius yangii]